MAAGSRSGRCQHGSRHPRVCAHCTSPSVLEPHSQQSTTPNKHESCAGCAVAGVALIDQKSHWMTVELELLSGGIRHFPPFGASTVQECDHIADEAQFDDGVYHQDRDQYGQTEESLRHGCSGTEKARKQSTVELGRRNELSITESPYQSH
jgi:hypothetical protein